MLLLVACAKTAPSVNASAASAGELPDQAELVIEDGDIEDTAAPVDITPAISTVAVPELGVPEGFSTSFGEVPERPGDAVASTVAPDAPSTQRVSAGRRASRLFEQIGSDCPPEAVSTQAEIGALTGAQLACAEVAIGRDTTDPLLRNELSLALIANARALQDPSWAGLVERHLTVVDPQNPSLALRLARYQHDQGNAEEAWRWANVALTHRADWPPSAYEESTLAAHQLRTSAAQTRWFEAREGDSLESQQLRNELVVAAEAWLEYERHLGRKGSVARRVCQAAGGSCP